MSSNNAPGKREKAGFREGRISRNRVVSSRTPDRKGSDRPRWRCELEMKKDLGPFPHGLLLQGLLYLRSDSVRIIPCSTATVLCKLWFAKSCPVLVHATYLPAYFVPNHVILFLKSWWEETWFIEPVSPCIIISLTGVVSNVTHWLEQEGADGNSNAAPYLDNCTSLLLHCFIPVYALH